MLHAVSWQSRPTRRLFAHTATHSCTHRPHSVATSQAGTSARPKTWTQCSTMQPLSAVTYHHGWFARYRSGSACSTTLGPLTSISTGRARGAVPAHGMGKAWMPEGCSITVLVASGMANHERVSRARRRRPSSASTHPMPFPHPFVSPLRFLLHLLGIGAAHRRCPSRSSSRKTLNTRRGLGVRRPRGLASAHAAAAVMGLALQLAWGEFSFRAEQLRRVRGPAL